MAEGLGFASITEAPGLVVHLWQRGGPSTGLPTRQEHADLKIAVPAGPRRVFPTWSLRQAMSKRHFSIATKLSTGPIATRCRLWSS